MGLSSLSQAFLASIDANQNTRFAAEAYLEACSSNPDIPFACLSLAISSDSHPVVQQSAAVFLKNLILKYWHLSINQHTISTHASRNTPPPINRSANIPDFSINLFTPQSQFSINKTLPAPNGNNAAVTNKKDLLTQSPFKAFSEVQLNDFKQQILYAFPLASSVVVNYLSAILSIFLKTSGIPQWPDLIPITIKMLTDADPNVIFSGVLVCLEITRYLNNLPLQNQWAVQLKADIVSLLFPQLLKVALSLSSETNFRAGLILWKILKCYKLVLRNDFPEHLQEESQVKDWLTFFLHILSSSYPNPVSEHQPSSANHPALDHSPSLSSSSSASYSSSSASSFHFSQGSSPSSQDSFSEFSPNKLLDCVARTQIDSWSKCKKNACIILSHLMVTYTSHSTSRASQIRVQKNFQHFSNIYLQYFGPEVCNIFLKDIEKWGNTARGNSRAGTSNAANTSNGNTLNETSLSSSPSAVEAIIGFFKVAISIDTLWQKMLPKMEVIVSHLIFGSVLLSESDLEAFYYNPEDYILTNVENSEFSTRGTALKFLSLLVKERKSDMFQGILIFINQTISNYNENPQSLQLTLEKDAALQMLIELRSSITDRSSPISSQINTFIIQQVINDNQSNDRRNSSTSLDANETLTACNTRGSDKALLLSRSCEVITSFNNVVYSASELEQVFRHVMLCFNDSEVIVRFNAAFALRMLFTQYDSICDVLGQEISQIMQKMLELYEEVNAECLASVMEDLIDKFTVQLAPFSVQLCSQLLDQFFRILGEINDRESQSSKAADDDDDSEGFSFVDDRQMVAVGILNALGTLLLALEKSPTHIAKLEPYLLPVFKTVIENANYTFYQEVFELLDTCLYTLRCITPNMVQVVSMMRKGFKKNPSQCCQYYGPVLCNLLKFGFPAAKQQQNLRSRSYSFIGGAGSTPNTAVFINSNGEAEINGHQGQNDASFLIYPPDLISLSFEFISHFLANKDSTTSEDISSEDTETACTLAQSFFLTTASVGIHFHGTGGAEEKHFAEIVGRALGALALPISSVVTYRSYLEVILTAALQNAQKVCDILIQYNCFNWIIDVTASRSDLFNRPYDKAVVGLALLKMAIACSDRGDGYEEVFPRVLNIVLTSMSVFYKHQQHEKQKCQNRNSFIFAQNFVLQNEAYFDNDQQSQHHSSIDLPAAPQQFSFVDESFGNCKFGLFSNYLMRITNVFFRRLIKPRIVGVGSCS